MIKNFNFALKDSSASRRKARKIWDVICLLMGFVIICSVLVCLREEYEIGEPAMHGFPLFFLVFLGYPFLELISIFNVIWGQEGSALVQFVIYDHQALGLGIINFASLIVCWALVRFLGLKIFGSHWVNVCSNFMMIFVGWGILQLLFYLMVFLWDSGGFSQLHTHLEDPEPEPEKVIIVDPKSMSNLERQHHKQEMKKQK